MRELLNHQNLKNQEISEGRCHLFKEKKLLKALYNKWYNWLLIDENGADDHQGPIIEIGTGPGFVKELNPNVFCSDIFPITTTDLACDGMQLPFKTKAVMRFIMINVFHHIKNSEIFLKEMNRCLNDRGNIVMIEPFNTFWGRIIWKKLHHEEFCPEKQEWRIDGDDPLFSANGALPWIVFSRDYKKFKQQFPELEVVQISTHSFISYVLSGGFSYPQLIPDIFIRLVLYLDQLICKCFTQLGIYAVIKLQKIDKKYDLTNRLN